MCSQTTKHETLKWFILLYNFGINKFICSKHKQIQSRSTMFHFCHVSKPREVGSEFHFQQVSSFYHGRHIVVIT